MKSELRNLSDSLKDFSAYIDFTLNTANAMSGEQSFNEFIKKEYGEKELFSWQIDELRKAFKTGFIIGCVQTESGKFKGLEKK